LRHLSVFSITLLEIDILPNYPGGKSPVTYQSSISVIVKYSSFN